MAGKESACQVAMVTGANRGCGLAFVRRLCQLPFPGVVYLTSRDEARGRAAVEQLKAEGLNPQYHQLDLGNSSSIQKFVEFIRAKHGGLDVVIANGAMPFPKDMSVDQIVETLRVNNKGNADLCSSLLPLLRPHARMLIVSSGFGQVKHLGPELRERFLATETMTVSTLNQLLDDYAHALRDGDFRQKGWPDWCNKVSKIGLVALARLLARQVSEEPERWKGVLVNAVCPGWTVTDTSRPYLDKDLKFGDVQAKQPDEAAVDVVWLATLPQGTPSPHGQLVQYRTVIPFDG